ncbi:high-affinity glucose transporter [Neofusicoccum parvum]|nr:high-affinity glucose transporter [Neofusicoccum parvum]
MLYGLDTGIIATTIAQASFKRYMYGALTVNSSVNGGIVSGYYAGSALGSAVASWSMDGISRRWSLLLGSTVSVIGAVVQAAAMNPAMMIVGRALSGFSTGMVYSIAPVYLSEVSPPENRAFLVGLKGLMNTLGFFLANWIGYAGSFAKGDIQWRVPLATQAPPAMLLMGLTLILPYSPRWLIQRERHEDALKVLRYLHVHRGEEWIMSEYTSMQGQIAFEAEMRTKSRYRDLFTRRYIRRTLLGCLIVNMTKLSGSNIIQNYQSVMYNALGFEGKTVLLISGLYGFMAVIGQILSLFTLSDNWPRKRTVCTGCAVLTACLCILTALSKFYPDSHNPSGSRAGVAFIFLYAFFYSYFFNTVNWVLVAEIFPLHLRARGNGFAVFSQAVTAIWLSYSASVAFDKISWKFYFVFIGCNMFAGTVYYFLLPETNLMTLEQVAAAFGDEIAVDGKPGNRETSVEKNKDGTTHVECVEETGGNRA